jgi:thiamine pyrophosphate-dependent acetolactate synthase large subunit-like protein
VRFPDTDFARIARGYGFEALTVRDVHDLEGVTAWLAGSRSAPMLIDAKVTREEPAWWLEEAFRGH